MYHKKVKTFTVISGPWFNLKTHYITWGRVMGVLLASLLLSANKKTLLELSLYPTHYTDLLVNVIIKISDILRNVKI